MVDSILFECHLCSIKRKTLMPMNLYYYNLDTVCSKFTNIILRIVICIYNVYTYISIYINDGRDG